MSTTHHYRHIKAPRKKVYHALLDANSISKWKVPDGMTCEVHKLEAHEGGAIRVSLTYDSSTDVGKTNSHTDTYHGYFLKLIPDELIVEVDEFETTDPQLKGKMTITISLIDSNGETELHAVHEGLPPGVLPKDNELGWDMSLTKLAKLVEA